MVAHLKGHLPPEKVAFSVIWVTNEQQKFYSDRSSLHTYTLNLTQYMCNNWLRRPHYNDHPIKYKQLIALLTQFNQIEQ